MTDLEMVKACAVAMGDLPAMIEHEGKMRFGYRNCMGPPYDPLRDDAQAAALVKHFSLDVWGSNRVAGDWKWHAVWHFQDTEDTLGHGDTWNRAIVECTVKLASLPPQAGAKG